jgi:hypothetical protein
MSNNNEKQNELIQRVMHCLLPELNKLDSDDEHKDWYCGTIHHLLTEAKRQDGNLAVAICNALEDYLK